MSPPGANRRGIFALIAATFAFTVNDATVKYVARVLPPGEIIFIRGTMTIICLAVALAVMGQLGRITTLTNKHVVMRSVFDGLATGFFVSALMRSSVSRVPSQ